MSGKPRGNPGHLPGYLFAKGGSTGWLTLVTMTILQLQFPWQLLIQSSWLPLSSSLGSTPPLQQSPCVRGGGAAENKKGSFVSL